MNRRLYFLLPDAEHALGVVRALEFHGVARRRIGIIAGRGAATAGLPDGLLRLDADPGERLEKRAWFGNLGLFFAALAALVVLLFIPDGRQWALVPAAIMAFSFVSGVVFVSHVPDVHRSEFRDALRHPELLLTVDVPASLVAEVESIVHRQHPEVVDGGVGWSVPALGI